MRSMLSVVLAVVTLFAAGATAPASAVDAPIGHIGDTPRPNGIVADVAPDALQYAMQNAPQGSTVGGRVFWVQWNL